MCDELRPTPLIDRDGLLVSASPWGSDDEIGRLNWLTSDAVTQVLRSLGGTKVFDLAVDDFIGMPSWTATGAPPFDMWMTHTPHGSMVDQRSGRGPDVHRRYSYCGDAMSMYTHTGTHIDTLNHMGHHGTFWNGWTPEEHLGSRSWTKGGTDRYPPIIARGVLLDVAATLGVDCLDESYAMLPRDLQDSAHRQQVELRRGDVVLVRTGRMTAWPHPDRYLGNEPGIDLDAARWLCEDVGAMCIASDTVALEVLPFAEDEYAPVHCYMFATAGAQIIEVVNMEEIAAERQYEFAFIGLPVKIHGATGAPLPCLAVPLG
jgi:kynurenine formamidase